MDMLYDNKAIMHQCHEEDEGSPMLCDLSSKEELMTSEGEILGRRNKVKFTKKLTYGMLLTCTVFLTVSLSFHFGHQLAIGNIDRRCMEHVSMYCQYPEQSSVC